MPKTKPTGFKRVKCDAGKSRLVKALPNYSKIERCGKDYEVYDTQGNYLGFSKDLSEAEFMALNGYTNRMDNASDLSLWLVWNDAVASGEKVLEDDEGKQFLSLDHDVVMSAKEDEHGWDVELLSGQLFWDNYRSKEFEGVLALKVAAKPLRLE